MKNSVFAFCLVRYIAVVSVVFIWFVILLLCLLCLFRLVRDLSNVATCLSIPAARFAFPLWFDRFVLLFVVDLSGKPKQNEGRG